MRPRVSQEFRRGQIYKGVSSAVENIVPEVRYAKFTANDPPASVQRAALGRLEKSRAKTRPAWPKQRLTVVDR